jgi:GDP-4-dehydro-6-deoxy-D-mannose reductase
MQRALVTGVSGFVGKHLANHLREVGWQVAGFDKRATEGDQSIFVGDIEDRAALVRVFQKCQPDVVFHLAGLIKSSQPETLYKANLLGTITLFESLLECGQQPVVFIASSSAVYGSGASRRPITEKFGTYPQTHYALSKAAQEMVALRYFRVHGLHAICVRTFNLLGPGLSAEMACSAFARQIAMAERSGKPSTISTGNLSSKRDFVDVRDAIRAYELIAKKGKPGEMYNVCSGRAVAVSECLSMLLDQARVPVEAVLDPAKQQSIDVPIQIGSAKKLHEATGWVPKIGLKKSLIDLLNDWRNRVEMERG